MAKPTWALACVLALSVPVGACASQPADGGTAGDAVDGGTPSSTLAGVGELPEALSRDPAALTPVGTVAPRPELLAQPDLPPVADTVSGNRVMVIGDSLTASLSERYGGELCDVLVPLGWQVETSAAVGRFIDYGQRVLNDRLEPAGGEPWDAVVINLGTNFGGDLDDYRVRLAEMLDRIGPRPVILMTVVEFRQDRVGVNTAIVEAMTAHPNVRVIDWAGIAGADPSLLQRDGIHLTDPGRLRMANSIADELGQAGGDGACLGSGTIIETFEDADGSPVAWPAPSPRPTTTVAVPAATTTTPTVSSSVSPTTGPSATTAPSTAPSATTAPSTTPTSAPPTTAPPTTAPATTSAPTTVPSTPPPTAAPTTDAPETVAPDTATPESGSPGTGDG